MIQESAFQNCLLRRNITRYHQAQYASLSSGSDKFLLSTARLRELSSKSLLHYKETEDNHIINNGNIHWLHTKS